MGLQADWFISHLFSRLIRDYRLPCICITKVSSAKSEVCRYFMSKFHALKNRVSEARKCLLETVGSLFPQILMLQSGCLRSLNIIKQWLCKSLKKWSEGSKIICEIHADHFSMTF